MSRRNEIKKDIWDILRAVYMIGDDRDITDKQNEFLDKVIVYLEANLSLRRKVVKENAEPEEVWEPLHRPTALVKVEPVKADPTVKVVEVSRKKKAASRAPKAESVIPGINLDALPPHLRKYALNRS